MLYRLACETDDIEFKKILKSIRISFWPEDYYSSIDYKNSLPGWADPPSADKRLQELNEKKSNIAKKMADANLYIVHNYSENDLKVTELNLPFLHRYYEYFLNRMWDYPYRDPKLECKNLFRLYPLEKNAANSHERDSSLYANYSKHWGDYNHFVNVVAATARFIQYFSDKQHIVEMIQSHELLKNVNFELLSEQVVYQPDGDINCKKRILQLMLAAYYHDIGKTVDYHRHGMEGANILANHTTRAVGQFNEILKAYHSGLSDKDDKFIFDKDDLLQISHIVFYHDQFGTLGTGEAGYLRFVDLIHRVRRHTVCDTLENQKINGRQMLFDLWVMNLADIMVSLEDKNLAQFELEESYSHVRSKNVHNFLDNHDSSITRIEAFLAQDKAQALIKDVFIALDLLDKQNTQRYADDLAPLQEAALNCAKQHMVDRIQRMLRSLLIDSATEYASKIQTKLFNRLDDDTPDDIKQALSNTGHIDAILEQITLFTEEKWSSVISRCIYSLGDYNEFSRRFCWIGQMDYAFGFFHAIVERALLHVNLELNLYSLGKNYMDHVPENLDVSTGWVYKNSEGVSLDPEFITLKNAEFFAENYTSTLIQILEHLLFREDKLDRIRNLEFYIARQRLSDEKIDRIIGLDGPFRTRRSVQLALESIFIW